MVSHKAGFNRLQRPTAHRLSLLRNLVTSLIEHERIKTTHIKAKACQRMADRMIEIGKHDNHNNRIAAQGYLYNSTSVSKLFDILGPRYNNRTGGYTRVVKAERRLNDNAPLSYIELIQNEKELRPTPNVATDKLQQYQQYADINKQFQHSLFKYQPVYGPPLGNKTSDNEEEVTAQPTKDQRKKKQ